MALTNFNNDESKSENNKGLLYDDVIALDGHTGPVLSASFDKEGHFIASGGLDKTIMIWTTPSEPDSEVNYGVVRGHNNAITSVRWSSDSSHLYSASADSTIRIWDLNTGKQVRKYNAGDLPINEIDSAGGFILGVSDDGRASLWDTRDKHEVGSVAEKYPILSATFDKNGQSFYFAGVDPTVRHYDVRKMSSPLWISGNQSDPICSLRISGDDSILISRTLNGIIRTYNAEKILPKSSSRLYPYLYEGASSGKENYLIRACFSPNGSSIASGSEDNDVVLWSYRTRRITNRYKGHEGTVIDVSYHPSGNVLMSTSADGSIILREL